MFVEVTPVPVSGALCGDPEALSEMLTVAKRVPVAEGVKVMMMEHVAFAATLAPLWHVLAGETVKSLGFAPLIEASLEKVSVDVPVFVMVSVCGALVALVA